MRKLTAPKVPAKENRQKKASTGSASPGKYKSLQGLSYLATAVILVLIAVAMGWYLDKTGTVRHVEISGNLFTETSDIVEVINIPEGIPADSLNFLQVIEKVEHMPYVKQAYITRSPSGYLKLRVRERKPVMLLLNSDSKKYVDKDGIRLPMQPGKSVDVPLLYATSAELDADTLKGEVFTSIIHFLQAADQQQPADLTISEIAWSDHEGVTAISHDEGYRLIFGDDNFDTRIQKWMSFYSKKILNEGIDTMEVIDLRFEGQIVTR